MPWVYFPNWKGNGLEPELASHLKSQNVHSCANCSIILNINDTAEVQRLCSEGLQFPGSQVHVAEVFVPSETWRLHTENLSANIHERIRREGIMQQHIESQSRQIAELHAEISRLQGAKVQRQNMQQNASKEFQIEPGHFNSMF